MQIVLISTYDLGRQPFGLASPAAWLREAGHRVTCLDLTRTTLTADVVAGADLVAFFLPMHMATRMALPVIDSVRAINPRVHLCAYGLYAPLNEAILRERGVQTVLGPEFEGDLAELAGALDWARPVGAVFRPRVLESATGWVEDARPEGRANWLRARVAFRTPDRSDLPPLSRYASLQVGDTRKVVGYTEATRGCKHRCRHCPIVPVYGGRFRAVPVDVVLADVRAQVAAGAEHITFGDPDFFNGPTHALAIVEALAREFRGVSYDVTVKVEHLLRQRTLLPRLRDTGCAFVTTAVESFDDDVLAALEKGHTHADAEDVARHCAEIGLTLSPTFVAFTPWTTLDGYCAMLNEIDRLGWVPAVSPIQYAIRLLVPQGSRMLELDDIRRRIERFDPKSLAWVWHHEDPGVDALQRRIEALVGAQLNAPRENVFASVRHLAYSAAGRAAPPRTPLVSRATIPYLNEPWYC